jgi:hypothetical protein
MGNNWEESIKVTLATTNHKHFNNIPALNVLKFEPLQTIKTAEEYLFPHIIT